MKIIKFLLLLVLIFPFKVNAEYNADITLSKLQNKDVIYFDASQIGWDEVYIHIWDNNGTTYKTWDNSDKLEKVSNNIFKYVYDGESNIYNHLLFKNKKSSSTVQTINLGFLKSGLAFKAESLNSNSKVEGYWYLYDKADIITKYNKIKKIQEDKKYYTTGSYSNLDELINSLNINEIKVETEYNSSNNPTGYYYLSVSPILYNINNIINNLKVDTTILKELILEEKNNLSDYELKYSKESVNNFKRVLLYSERILLKNNITVNEIKEEIEKIEDAKSKLVLVAKKVQTNDSFYNYCLLFIISLIFLNLKKILKNLKSMLY